MDLDFLEQKCGFGSLINLERVKTIVEGNSCYSHASYRSSSDCGAHRRAIEPLKLELQVSLSCPL